MNSCGKWIYSGDGNLEYGGVFIDLSTWDDGYCYAVRVTDLDGGIGFRGASIIEHVTVLGMHDRERVRSALNCAGLRFRRGENTKQQVRFAIVEALLSYGFYDVDDLGSETVQTDPDGPMRFDGWRASRRLHNTSLEAYVQSVHLTD